MTPTTADPADRPHLHHGLWHKVRKVLMPLASLQITVVLFALSIALIFFGTVAQMDHGVWTVVDRYFWSWVVMVPFDLFNKVGQVFFDFPRDAKWEGSFPFPAGKLLGGAMLVNLLAAHLVRFKLSWKRSGILLIHGGLILLFVGEFVTREYAIEQRMVIPEGEAVNFTQDARICELAFVDASNPSGEKTTVVPESMLKEYAEAGRISDTQLPVEVEVVEFMSNSTMVDLKPGERNPADRGFGLQGRVRAEAKPEVSGTDTDQKADMQAAYVRFIKKGSGDSLGTYLLVSGIERKQELTVDGKTFEVALRPKRYYKPYTIHLVKFRFDRYLGTDKPKNYSSQLIVKDDDEAEPREVTVRMNEPFRHRGETFYQGGFDPNTETTTILQVVKNPGWLIPYISCVVVTVGLLIHFGIYLTLFLKRRAAA